MSAPRPDETRDLATDMRELAETFRRAAQQNYQRGAMEQRSGSATGTLLSAQTLRAGMVYDHCAVLVRELLMRNGVGAGDAP